MSDRPDPDEALRSELSRVGLHADPERFDAFCIAYQKLQGLTEHLRQQALISVQQLKHRDDH